jgi:hypothetical protein
MGFTALALSMIFRTKFYEPNKLPKNLSVNVFNKIFSVFNPYRESVKTIHNHLLLLPFITCFSSFLFGIFLFYIFMGGLALILFILPMVTNLIVVDGAFEVYENAKILLKAIRNGENLGVGDLKVLSNLRVFTRKISIYYLGITIFLFVLSMILPFILYPALLAFSFFIGLIIQASSTAGLVNWQLAALLFSLTRVFIELILIKVRDKIFKM